MGLCNSISVLFLPIYQLDSSWCKYGYMAVRPLVFSIYIGVLVLFSIFSTIMGGITFLCLESMGGVSCIPCFLFPLYSHEVPLYSLVPQGYVRVVHVRTSDVWSLMTNLRKDIFRPCILFTGPTQIKQKTASKM